MSGFVYVIRETGSRRVKIGHSANPFSRGRGLQTGNSDDLEIEVVVRGTKDDEAAYHDMLRHEHVRGEWFAGKDTEALVDMLRPKPQQCPEVAALLHRVVQMASHCGARSLWEPAIKPGPNAWISLLHDTMQAASAGAIDLHADERLLVGRLLDAIREVAWEPNEIVAPKLAWLAAAVGWAETWADRLVIEPYEPENLEQVE